MAVPNSRDFGAELGPEAAPQAIDFVQDESIPRPKVKVNFADTFQDEDQANQNPERLLMDTMRMRPRAMSHHLQSGKIPSRMWLKIKAKFWRSLMTFGMTFHDYAPPKPPKPSFIRRISTDTVPIDLYFYVPKEYDIRKKEETGCKYPIVVNFHGGGFCMGHATDDRYWAAVVLKETPAVFVSVGYRRAPEHPFPQPVDDCVEALLYLQTHAEELHLDPSQTALSGFSAGANLAFTVPFRLTYQYERQPSAEDLPLELERTNESNWVPDPEDAPDHHKDSSPSRNEHEMDHLMPLPPGTPVSKHPSPWASASDLTQISTNRSGLPRDHSRTNLLNLPGPRSHLLRTITDQSRLSKLRNHSNPSTNNVSIVSSSSDEETVPQLRIVSVVAWYPLLDWTSSRSEKKRSSRNPKKTLPAVFTNLFDFSYLPAPDVEGHHCSPYASPSLAPDHMIVDGLPQRIQMWLCEWDMLLAEGEHFRDKLHSLGKEVQSEIIPGVPHGWDKSPNPFRDQKMINGLYTRASGYLRDVFEAADRRATVGEGIGLGGLR